jgi:hypothetical protein
MVLFGGNSQDFIKQLYHAPKMANYIFMFSQYITMSSTAKFPSLSAAQFQDLVTNDRNGVYRVDLVINSERLMPV